MKFCSDFYILIYEPINNIICFLYIRASFPFSQVAAVGKIVCGYLNRFFYIF